MTQHDKEKIAIALREKGVSLPCPRCNKLNFEVVGQTMLTLNNDSSSIKIGGPSVACAIVGCSGCGFITLHALSSIISMN